MEDDRLFDDQVIDASPRKRRVWLYVVLALIVVIFLFGSQLLAIYVNALWFGSLGYGDVYWYKFRLGGVIFIIFLVVSFLAVRLPFLLMNRALPQLSERPRIRLRTVEDLREINFLPLIYRPGVWVLSAIVAFAFAISMSKEWPAFALYLNSSAAEVTDPLFNRDVSFYLFKLPVLELVSGWLTTITLVLLLAVGAVSGYVWYVEKIQGFATSETRRRVTASISAAGALFLIAVAVSSYLSRYDLLNSRHDLFTGASFIDANVRLVALNILVGALLLAAVVLLLNAFVLKRPRLIPWTAAGLVAVWIVGLVIIPQSVHSFSVKPNELAKESPFIQHNINMTRKAFGLDRFEEKPFQPAPTLTSAQIQENRETIDNIRLWDPHALQSTFSQIQEIRTYYEFRVPDVDRYMMGGRLRQVMVAAREMNVNQLPEQSRNWINQHLVYTHGYGVAMSTVNEFTGEGLPHLILKNMPVESDVPDIKVTRPEVYFGEVTNSHVYVHTKSQASTQPEFNFPAPDNTDSYNEYEGTAGIPVGGLLRQTALSLYLGDGTNLLFSDYITSDSRVLMRRNVVDRVRQVAPFILFEEDPYIVISREGKLYWIIDGYTHSDRYPYSTAHTVASHHLNYIRNSVKAVVDAYDGEVKLYVFDADLDPLIRSYQRIFPSLFVASSEMPEDLMSHIRYPNMLTEVQARAFTVYHMHNPQTFYNREDLWAIATVESSGVEGAQPIPMQPYYVLMQLPTENPKLEFVNIQPFTPAGPGRNNMIGWMAARSDPETYGQTLVFSFPKNLTVSGPAQIKARFNQDAQLSGQITLWNQQGSRVIRGNLQAIPIADSLLYIEPFYLQAVNSPLPELRQVAIATQDRLAIGKTFDEALNSLFTGLASQGPAPASRPADRPPQAQPSTQASPPPQAQPGVPPAAGESEGVIRQAGQLMSDYKRLTAEGKYREAGEKLEQLNQLLTEYNRKRSGN